MVESKRAELIKQSIFCSQLSEYTSTANTKKFFIEKLLRQLLQITCSRDNRKLVNDNNFENIAIFCDFFNTNLSLNSELASIESGSRKAGAQI